MRGAMYRTACGLLGALVLFLFSVLSPPSAQSQQYTLYTFAFLGLNIKSPPFSTVDARRAVMTAVDRYKAAVAAAYSAAPATGIIPPGCIGYNRAARIPGPDAQGAAELLARSGLGAASQGEVSLWLRQGGVEGGARVVVENLRAAGLRVAVKEYGDFNAFRRTIATPAVHLYHVRALTDACHRSTLVELLTHSKGILNLSGHTDTTVDGLIDRARGASDSTARDRLLAEAEQRVLDNAVLIPLWWEDLPARSYRVTAEAAERGVRVRVAEVSLDIGARVNLSMENGTDSDVSLTRMLLDARLVDEWGRAARLSMSETTLQDRIPAKGSVVGVLHFFSRNHLSTRRLTLMLPTIEVGDQEVSLQIDISPP